MQMLILKEFNYFIYVQLYFNKQGFMQNFTKICDTVHLLYHDLK